MALQLRNFCLGLDKTAAQITATIYIMFANLANGKAFGEFLLVLLRYEELKDFVEPPFDYVLNVNHWLFMLGILKTQKICLPLQTKFIIQKNINSYAIYLDK